MRTIARVVEEVLDDLGYDRVDALGVSSGGALAQQFARQSPERVRRLILAATACGVPGLGGVPGRPRAMLALATPRRYCDRRRAGARSHAARKGGSETGRINFVTFLGAIRHESRSDLADGARSAVGLVED
jgi:pimeloyl-ACP methyl ester carboxylesterase